MDLTAGNPLGAKTLKIDQLNTVETSVETWRDFCNISMETEFYQVALERTGDPREAAGLTLLRNYISTFAPDERERLESDVEYFYKYADGFIKELAAYRYNKSGYDSEIRAIFFGKIRALLDEHKDEKGRVTDRNKYEFIRSIVKFCSSLDHIIQVHDRYKTFLFREMPQIRDQGRS